MGKLFRTVHTIRFSHCDASGIVYFVHLYQLANDAVEDWFEEGLGRSFETLHLKQRIGSPVVSNRSEFYKPLRLGERLTIELAVARLGRSSIEYRIAGTVADEVRFRAWHKTSMISLDTHRSIEIPADLRARMAEYLVESGASTTSAPDGSDPNR